MSADLPTRSREPRGLREGPILAGITLFLAAITALYWFISYEDAGTVMLLLATVMVGMLAGYVVLSERRIRRTGAAGEAAEEEPYLPHASVWPFAVGAGAIVVANGLALGLWAVVVGGIVLVGGILGYSAQSRARR